MKKLSAMLWSLTLLAASNTFATELKVTVQNVEVERGGQLIVMVFGESGFPIDHSQAAFSTTQDRLQSTMEFTFNVAMEELAIKILHDEDNNGKLTKNWTGVYPREGLGFSNGQKIGLTGPPKYKYSKLTTQQFKNGLSIPVLYP